MACREIKTNQFNLNDGEVAVCSLIEATTSSQMGHKENVDVYVQLLIYCSMITKSQ